MTNRNYRNSNPLQSDEAIRRRCKDLRKALGYEQSMSFAAALGISPQRWSNIGVRLSNDVAMRIVTRFPAVDLNWLYLGRTDGLSVGLATKLGELPETSPRLPLPSKTGKR